MRIDCIDPMLGILIDLSGSILASEVFSFPPSGAIGTTAVADDDGDANHLSIIVVDGEYIDDWGRCVRDVMETSDISVRGFV